jgi:membrane protein YdbS with pleckstrin-like domain
MIPAILSVVFALIGFVLIPKTGNHYFRLSLLVSFYGILTFILLQYFTSNIGSPDNFEYSELLAEINRQELKIVTGSLISLFVSFVLSSVLSYLQIQKSSEWGYKLTFLGQMLLTIFIWYMYILAGSFII